MALQRAKPLLIDEMLSHLKADFVDYDSSSQVANFYANRSVFITGATGFIGKALVEKLVRSCKDIKRIYLLIREKGAKNAEDRLSDLIDSQIFSRIKAFPNGRQMLEDKLKAIRGDITRDKFGISDEDMAELKSEISIVFNSAATVRFVEPIDVAVRNNIYSVAQLVEFCNGLQNLQALIHLSTAYTNCNKLDTIHEIFYEPPMRGDQIMSALNSLKQIQQDIHIYPNIDKSDYDDRSQQQGDGLSRNACEQQIFYSKENSQWSNCAANLSSDLLEEFTQIALRRSNRPNTYTFTKAISEYYLLDLVKRQPERYLNDNIPIAIIRPSIVGGVWKEPQVGFVDNFNGPSGAILSLYTGSILAMPGNGQCVADLVPVDMCANMVLCTGWFLISEQQSGGQQKKVKQDEGLYLFNFVSGRRNPLRWHQITDLIAVLSYKYPSIMLNRLPSSFFIKAGKLYDIYDLIFHKSLAILADFFAEYIMRRQLTNRTSALSMYRRCRTMVDILTPFTSNQWRFSDSNVCALYDKLDQVDRQLFEFDVKKIDWTNYIRNYIIGSRIYALKDEPRNLKVAVKSLRKRQIANQVGQLLLFLFFYYFLFHQSHLESAIKDSLASIFGL